MRRRRFENVGALGRRGGGSLPARQRSHFLVDRIDLPRWLGLSRRALAAIAEIGYLSSMPLVRSPVLLTSAHGDTIANVPRASLNDGRSTRLATAAGGHRPARGRANLGVPATASFGLENPSRSTAACGASRSVHCSRLARRRLARLVDDMTDARAGRRSKPGPPMTLANMRQKGVRVVIARCEACGQWLT